MLKLKLFLGFIVVFLVSPSHASASEKCGFNLKSLYEKLPWVAAKKFEYVLKVQLLTETMRQVVKENQLVSLENFKDPGRMIDFGELSRPNGKKLRLSVGILLSAGRAWKRRGNAHIRYYRRDISGVDLGDIKFIGGTLLQNEMMMEFRSTDLPNYFIRVTTIWQPRATLATLLAK